MVLKEKHTTVAYRCPFCGSGVMSAVGLFGLSADMVKLKCPCGKSEMQIVRQRESAADGTVRLTVPCLLCPKPHTFTLRDAVFFSDDLFTLPCPYSDVNICFTGEINRVKAELARTELELLDMLEQNGIADFSALHGDERDLGDPQVREVVLYVIRELEAELGITLFERTARGVAPTNNGEDFLGYARSIIAQMESLETMFGPHTETGTQLSVCAPRASYVAQAFSRYLGAEGRAPLQVQYRETSAAAVISDVASGTANLGVVRWQAEHAATLDNLLRENALSGEVLWEFSMVVLLHERHPLAALGDIPYHLLGDYPEIVHGDLTPVLPAEQPAQAAGGRQGRIAVFDRGGQFDILRNVPGSYMWVSPVPFEILAQQELVQKPCRSASRYRDVLVRRRPGALSAAEVAFINELRREIAGLVQT